MSSQEHNKKEFDPKADVCVIPQVGEARIWHTCKAKVLHSGALQVWSLDRAPLDRWVTVMVYAPGTWYGAYGNFS